LRIFTLRRFLFLGAEGPYADVPKYINAMDIGISCRKGTPASQLKLYEYAVCGKPVVSTYGQDFGPRLNSGGFGIAYAETHAEDGMFEVTTPRPTAC